MSAACLALAIQGNKKKEMLNDILTNPRYLYIEDSAEYRGTITGVNFDSEKTVYGVELYNQLTSCAKK